MKKIISLLMALTATSLSAAPKLDQDQNLVSETLPSGMTIAAYRNLEPPKRVSMRLLIKHGSSAETERERGIAHFIEHMAFNGTDHFPSGNMVEYFQRLGMAFGADTNAHTGFSETVYKLDMPEVSQKLIDDGFLLLRDYCDKITFAPDSIERERGVILAEKDSRDNQDYRKAVKEIAHYFKGSIFSERMPIGEASVIKYVKQDDFKRFYTQTYRPENTVLVIVGDIEPKKIIEEAKKYFVDYNANKIEPARKLDFGKLETSDFEFDFGTEKLPIDIVSDSTPNSSKSYAAISVAKEIVNRPDSLDKRIQDIRIKAISYALTARYLRVTDMKGSKISQGNGGSFDFDKYCRVVLLSSEAPISKAADALEENFRQLLSFKNLTNSEIENSKKKIFENIDSAIKSKDTRTNRELSNEITSAYSDNEAFTSPETDLEIAKYALADFTANDAINMLKELFSGGKIKVFVSDTSITASTQELEKIAQNAFENAKKSTYDASIFATQELKFTNFQSKGKIVQKTELPDLKITQIQFENGVRLNIKKTDFAKDEVLMRISFGNGILDIPTDKPEYFASMYALISGGTKFQSASEITAARYLLKMNLSLSVDGNSFSFAGASTSKDFVPMVKLAATMCADSGFRDDGLEPLQKYGEAFYLDYQTSPMAKARYITMQLIATNIAKVPGTYDNFKKITMAEMADWLRPILEKSYMEISVVGDIETEEAIELFSSTFGAMPARDAQKDDPFASLRMQPEGTEINQTYQTTDEPRSIAAVMWQSCGRQDIVKMRTDNVLGAILDDVLRSEVREKKGKVYSPFAYNNSSTWIKDFGLLTSMTFVIPDANEELIQTLKECGKKVRSDITQDQFERAKIPLLKGVEANKRKNEYWLSAVLNLSQAQPVNIELARTIDTGYEMVTLDDVKKAAEKIFATKPYSASIMPQKIEK